MSRQNEVAPAGRTGGLKWQTVVAVAAAVIGIIVLIQNSETVQVQFLFLHLNLWLWLLLLLMFILGGLFGGAVWDMIWRRDKD